MIIKEQKNARLCNMLDKLGVSHPVLGQSGKKDESPKKIRGLLLLNSCY